MFQAKDDPTRAIAERHRRGVARALKAAIKSLQRSVPIDAVTALIARKDVAGAADAVNLASFKHALREPFERLADVYRAALRLGGEQFNAARATARLRKDSATLSGAPEQPDKFAVDLYSDRVLAELRAYQDEFIGALTDDMRQKMFDLIVQGVRRNVEPAEIAKQIRDTIGLSDQLARAVVSYRTALENIDAAALERQLRDESADADVAGAIESGTPLSPERIDKLVSAYADRALDYRAQMIAQTESTRMSNMGLEAAYQQMIDESAVPSEAVKKHWRVSLDEKTCGQCIELATVYDAGLKIGELFGEDLCPPLHVNCRCSLEIITNLDLIPDDSPALEAA